MKNRFLYPFRKAVFLSRLAILPKQSHPLAVEAVRALKANEGPHDAGQCQKWVRKRYERVWGKKFSFAHRPSAVEASQAFAGTLYDVPLERGSREGDILYKEHGSGGKGHAVIRLRGNMVAENSSVHDDDDGNAIGLRTMAEFGAFDRIVRLK